MTPRCFNTTVPSPQNFIMADQQAETSGHRLVLSPAGDIEVDHTHRRKECEDEDKWEDIPMEDGDLEMKFEGMKLGERAEDPPASAIYDCTVNIEDQLRVLARKIKKVNIRSKYRKEDKKAADRRDWKANRFALNRELEVLHQERRGLLAKACGMTYEQYETRRKKRLRTKKENKRLRLTAKALEKLSLG
ncbi:hypothetical protein K491DRAFT_783665 [Lophiostoma macrostomum CBS 122681]|uniref:Uncharacterized protein n=1 Tax=Lophiostoma macrostomum CBS 122681 TaxID=1314788 RepID=A0A6A6SRJ2_9PLEO|nr:hypothetical protein K491DRAFT_783665 [Lophiostoma macrostomum CBS 122681]